MEVALPLTYLGKRNSSVGVGEISTEVKADMVMAAITMELEGKINILQALVNETTELEKAGSRNDHSSNLY